MLASEARLASVSWHQPLVAARLGGVVVGDVVEKQHVAAEGGVAFADRTGARLTCSRWPAGVVVTNCAEAAASPRAMRRSMVSRAWSMSAASITAWIERPRPISSAPPALSGARERRRKRARARPL